jgi:hypothetical protein
MLPPLILVLTQAAGQCKGGDSRLCDSRANPAKKPTGPLVIIAIVSFRSLPVPAYQLSEFIQLDIQKTDSSKDMALCQMKFSV